MYSFFSAAKPSKPNYSFDTNSDDYNIYKENFSYFCETDSFVGAINCILRQIKKEKLFNQYPLFFEMIRREYPDKANACTEKFYEVAMQHPNIGQSTNYMQCLNNLGYSIHHKNTQGKTLLHLAAKIDQPHIQNVIQFLVSQNVDINAKDSNGKTALMGAVTAYCDNNNATNLAVSRGNINAVQILLFLNANKGLKDKSGKTALDHVKEILTSNPNNSIAQQIIGLLDPDIAKAQAAEKQAREQAKAQKARAEAEENMRQQQPRQQQARQQQARQQQARQQQARQQQEQARQQQARRQPEINVRAPQINRIPALKNQALTLLEKLKKLNQSPSSLKVVILQSLASNITALQGNVQRMYDGLNNKENLLQLQTKTFIENDLLKDIITFVQACESLPAVQKIQTIQAYQLQLKEKIAVQDRVTLGLDR